MTGDWPAIVASVAAANAKLPEESSNTEAAVVIIDFSMNASPENGSILAESLSDVPDWLCILIVTLILTIPYRYHKLSLTVCRRRGM